MQIVGNFIVLKQFLGKTGNATVTLCDLDAGGVFKVTWSGGQLSEQAAADRSPHRLLLDGVEMRRGDNGDYLSCVAIGLADVPQKKGG